MKRKILIVTILLTMAMSSMTVYAAPKTMPDGTVFDAEYYAQNNPDVVAVYGKSEKKLYEHYQKYGKVEGRAAYDNNDAVARLQRGEITLADLLKEAETKKRIPQQFDESKFLQLDTLPICDKVTTFIADVETSVSTSPCITMYEMTSPYTTSYTSGRIAWDCKVDGISTPLGGEVITREIEAVSNDNGIFTCNVYDTEFVKTGSVRDADGMPYWTGYDTGKLSHVIELKFDETGLFYKELTVMPGYESFGIPNTHYSISGRQYYATTNSYYEN